MPSGNKGKVAEVSLANLIPYTKGQSGNISGRPKTDHVLISALEAAVDKDALAQKVVELAMNGSETMLKYIYDRLAGKPVERMEAKLLYQVGERAEELARAYGLSVEDVREQAKQIARGT